MGVLFEYTQGHILSAYGGLYSLVYMVCYSHTSTSQSQTRSKHFSPHVRCRVSHPMILSRVCDSGFIGRQALNSYYGSGCRAPQVMHYPAWEDAGRNVFQPSKLMYLIRAFYDFEPSYCLQVRADLKDPAGQSTWMYHRDRTICLA